MLKPKSTLASHLGHIIQAGFRSFVSGHSNKPESLAAIGVVWDLKGLVPNVGIVSNKKGGGWFLSDFFLALLLSGGSLLIAIKIRE